MTYVCAMNCSLRSEDLDYWISKCGLPPAQVGIQPLQILELSLGKGPLIFIYSLDSILNLLVRCSFDFPFGKITVKFIYVCLFFDIEYHMFRID